MQRQKPRRRGEPLWLQGNEPRDFVAGCESTDGHQEKPNPVAKEQRTNVGTVALGSKGLGHLRLR